MQLTEHYRSEVATVSPEASIRQVVECMAQQAIGCVLVVEGEQPVGIVTDRDLACRVIAQGRDFDKTRAGEVMSKPLVCASPQDAIENVVERMRAAGVRRIPILQDGRLVGLVTLDDLLIQLARELEDLGEAVRREIQDARQMARLEGRREHVEETLRDFRDQLEKMGQETRDLLGREFEALRERLRRLRS